MKATGIIRRIDDLGRVVIPKEIRRTMNIREGDPLEIFLDKETNMVCFSKYHALGINNEEIVNTALDMAKASKVDIAIYNEDWRVTQNGGNGLFPPDTPDEWRNQRKPLETDELLVIPIVSTGELFGYVASKCRNETDVEVIMIARYITAAIAQKI